MATINDLKITDQEVSSNGIQGVSGDRLDMSVNDAKKRFDKLPTLIRDRLNSTIDYFSSLITNTNTSIRNDFSSADESLGNRITALENNRDVGEIDSDSIINVDVSGDPENISSGMTTISSVLNNLSSNSNKSRADVSTITDNLSHTIKYDNVINTSTTQPFNSYNDLNQFVTIGTYSLQAISYSNAPFSNRASKNGYDFIRDSKYAGMLIVEKDSSSGNVVYQKYVVKDRFSYGGYIVEPATYTRVGNTSTNSWSSWSTDGVSHHSISSSTSTTPSYIRIGNILVAYGYLNTGSTISKATKQIKINMPVEFKYPPTVQATMNGKPQVNTLILSVSDVTSTSFYINLYQEGTTDRNLRWFAIGVALD